MPTVQIDGAEHYHEIHGSGTPLLLLHGGFCSLEILRPQLDSLATYSTVHAPERPGHGRTPDISGPYTYAQSVSTTLAYMDAVGLSDAHVVGFSDGAIIGLILALDHPERVRSLVAISSNLDPSGFVGSDDLEDSDNTETPEPQEPHDQQESHSIYRDHYTALSPDGPDHVEVVLEKLMHLWTHEPGIDPATLARISCPTLVMAGKNDVIRPEHTRLIASSIPGSELYVVPDAGHDLMETRPDLVNSIVKQFISTNSDR